MVSVRLSPLKSFLTRSRERVDDFSPEKNNKAQVIVGVKSCDIASLRVQDLVFKNTEPVDPFFASKRDNTTIISSDCNMLWDSCFCTALEIDPYSERGFDLNLSKEADYFVVDVGSEKGQCLIDSNKDLFKKANENQIKNRASNRTVFKNKLKSQVQEKEVPTREELIGSVAKRYEDTELWSHFASTCIECGGCNHCCPACHCFVLSDQKKGELKGRFKTWDACLYNRFAVVAGGANPRKHLYERLRNRFDKKFDFFQEVLGSFGCTGCGRCTEACPGKIDIKEVLKRIVQKHDA